MTDSTNRAREAFADLSTPEKTAFVIEATFSTIGAAFRETGQRLGEIITDFDPESFARDAFASPEAQPKAKPKAKPKRAAKPRGNAAAPKTSTAKKAAAKKAAAKKPAAAKTAGRSRKKKDDGA